MDNSHLLLSQKRILLSIHKTSSDTQCILKRKAITFQDSRFESLKEKMVTRSVSADTK